MTNKPTAVFITGPAGTGKTFFARRIAMLSSTGIINKDALTMDLVAEMNKCLGIDENDRESVLYQKFVRPFEYGVVHNETVKRLKDGKNVIVDAPYMNLVARKGGLTGLRKSLIEEGFNVIMVWMEQDVEATKLRLENRGYLRDTWKISHWEEYATKIRQVDVPYDEFDFCVTPDNLDEKLIEISDILYKS